MEQQVKTADREVYSFVAQRISRLSVETSAARAAKARLRRAAGKMPEETPEIWDSVLFELPVGLDSNERALQAIHLALTLFAAGGANGEKVTLGAAMRHLAAPGDEASKSKKRRFDAVITANGYKELSNHLRGLVQLLRQAGIGLDYALLAQHIYKFLKGGDAKNKICLRWGMDYYKTQEKVKVKETSQNEQNE